MTAIRFFTGVASAILVKLTSSIDDVLWLSAFLTPSSGDRLKNAITYTIICLIQTMLAYAIAQFGSSVVDEILGDDDDTDRISTDRLLTLVAGGCMFLYSIVLGKEYYDENYGDDDEYELTKVKELDDDDDGDEEVAVAAPVSEPVDAQQGTGESSAEVVKEEEENNTVKTEVLDEDEDEDSTENKPPSDKKARPLAIIAFLGSLDDLTLFVPMLVGKALTIDQLIIGSMVAIMMIVSLCVFLTQCRMVANLLEKIPLVAIVLGFSVILLTKGIFFMT